MTSKVTEAAEFIRRLAARGITLTTVGQRLEANGPAEALDDGLRTELAARKPELIQLLKRPKVSTQPLRPFDIITRLHLCGATLRVDGDKLIVTIPDGGLTAELTDAINKGFEELKAALARRIEIADRLDAVFRRAAELEGDKRINFDTDTPEARAAEQNLEACIVHYINGDVSTDAVERAFQAFIHTFMVKTTEQETLLTLFN